MKKIIAILFMVLGFIAATSAYTLIQAPAASAKSFNFNATDTKSAYNMSASQLLGSMSHGGGVGGIGSGSGGKGTTVVKLKAQKLCIMITPDNDESKKKEKCIPKYESLENHWASVDENGVVADELTNTPMGHYSYTCPPVNRNGMPIAAVGAVMTTSIVNKELKKLDEKPWYQHGYDVVVSEWNCVYPEKTKKIASDVVCVLSLNAKTTRTSNSYVGGAPKVVKTKTGKYSGNGNIANIKKNTDCVRENKVTFDYDGSIGREQVNWGIYNVNMTYKYTICSFSTSNFDGKTIYAQKCGAERTKTVPGSFTLSCGFAQKGSYPRSWTGADCPTISKSQYSCTIPNPAKYNGKTGSVQVTRDGTSRNLVWGTPKMGNGMRGATNWRTTTQLLGGSTPNIKDLGPSDSKQLYYYNKKFNKNWQKLGSVSAANLTDKLAFYTAANPGGKFQIKRNYMFDAQYKVVTSEPKSMAITTGNITFVKRTEWIKATDAPCGPQLSPAISVLRAIGTEKF